MPFLTSFIHHILTRFPGLAMVLSAAGALLFGYLGFFDPEPAADDLLFFRLMTGVAVVGMVFFGLQARHRRHERRHPPSDLAGWSPQVDPNETLTTVTTESRYFVVTNKSSGQQIHTVVLANRDGLWLWHGGTKAVRDVIGFVELRRLPSEQIEPRLRVHWAQLGAIMHRGLSTKLDVEVLDGTGRPSVKKLDLEPNTTEVFDRLADWGWPEAEVRSPPALRRRDLVSNLWLAAGSGFLVGVYGQRWLGSPDHIVAGVVTAVVLTGLIWLSVGWRSTRRALMPLPPVGAGADRNPPR